MDQSSFAAPHGFSQRITSFIACACQGIHQMPLRHLIVLIANAHHLVARFRRKRQQTRLPFTTRSIQQCHRRVRPDHFIGATPSSSLVSGLKTSFSRYDPIPRGQATVIRSFIRRYPKAANNKRSRATSFLPTSSPSPISGRLGHPWDHQNWARTPWAKPKTPGSLQINLLFTMYAEQASGHKPMQTFISSKDKFLSLTRRRRSAGAPNDWRRALRLRASPGYRQSQHQSIWWS